jgi:hypothetical protein
MPPANHRRTSKTKKSAAVLTKEVQMNVNDLIAAHLASKGATKCAPAHAHGNEMRGAGRRHVAKVRAQWANDNETPLKVGQVRQGEVA